MAKEGRTGQSAIVRNMQKTKCCDTFFFFSFFILLIFVNFDIFTIHIFRNYYKEMEYICKKKRESLSFSLFLIYFSDIYINVKYE